MYIEQILQEIADVTTQILDIPRVRVKVRDFNRGRYYHKYSRISIPKHALKQSVLYLTYYVVHEVCHYFRGRHDTVFTAHETKALSIWGLRRNTDTVYAYKLYDTKTGKRVWGV